MAPFSMSKHESLTALFHPAYAQHTRGLRTRMPVYTDWIKRLECTSCAEYIYKGRKFNSRKESPPEEKYLVRLPRSRSALRDLELLTCEILSRAFKNTFFTSVARDALRRSSSGPTRQLQTM